MGAWQNTVGRARHAVTAALAIAAFAVLPATPAPASAATAPNAGLPDAPGATCPDTQAPPPPAAREEAGSVTAPLPWPATPVGGPLLDACGDVLPPGVTAPATVGASSWVLADLDTGAVLAAHAPHARNRPASTLKILTALVAIDRLDPDLVVTGTAEDANIDGSRVGIGPDGRYTVRQLLAGLLLNSGNDTANALARALGGPAVTTDAMNATAAQLGALDTRAATPSGLDGPGMSSSAYDLATFFRVAMRNPLFAQTIATRSAEFPGYGSQPGFMMSNTDKLLAHYPGTLGGKTGFTDAARHTFVGAAARNGRRLVVALEHGEQHPVPMWQQAGALLDLGFALPATTAPVGTLDYAAPAAPAEQPSGEPDDRPGVSTSTRLALAAAVGAAAVGLGILARRRFRRGGRIRSGGA